MSLYTNVDGELKSLSLMTTNVNGELKIIGSIYANINNELKEVYFTDYVHSLKGTHHLTSGSSGDTAWEDSLVYSNLRFPPYSKVKVTVYMKSTDGIHAVYDNAHSRFNRSSFARVLFGDDSHYYDYVNGVFDCGYRGEFGYNGIIESTQSRIFKSSELNGRNVYVQRYAYDTNYKTGEVVYISNSKLSLTYSITFEVVD